MALDTRLIAPHQLDVAVAALLAGELVVFPTDTVYGIAAVATDAAAAAALFAAKLRPSHVALPVMVAETQQVQIIAQPTPRFWDLARRFWPGPLTLVLPKTPVLPDVVTAGLSTVGVRIPDHAVALALLRAVAAPLAVTSANLSGQAPAIDASAALQQLRGRVACIIDDGPAPGGQPSTVLDLSQSPAVILRPGPISAEALQL